MAKAITHHSLTGQNIIIFHDGLFNIINRKNWRITIKLHFENLSIKHTHMLGPSPPLPPLPFSTYVLFEWPLVAFSFRKKRWTKKNFFYFKKKSQSKDETSAIQITNVLTSLTENVASTRKRWCKRHKNDPKNRKSKFLGWLRKKLTCMQEILVLLKQLKSSLLNIRNILLSEPQLRTGRRSTIMVTRSLLRELEDPTC